MGLGSEEVGIPYAQKATKDRDILLQWCLLEMLVHGLSTGKEFVEVIKPDIQGNTQANRTPDAVPATYPASEAEHILLIDTKFGDFLLIGGEGDEVFCNVFVRPGGLEKPSLCGVGIGRRLGRGEGLGRNQEQRRFRIGIAQGLGNMCAVDVGHKMELQAPITIRFQGLCYHDRPTKLVVSYRDCTLPRVETHRSDPPMPMLTMVLIFFPV